MKSEIDFFVPANPYQGTYERFVYGLWAEHSLGVLFWIFLVMFLIVLIWDRIKARYRKFKINVRTWRMTPEQFEQWQKETISSGIVDLFDNYVKMGVVPRSKAHSWMVDLGRLWNFGDLIPRDLPPKKPNPFGNKLRELAKKKENGSE